MQENEKKAFDFAADTTKQLLTLATAIIALTITFSKDIIGSAENVNPIIFWAWGLYVFSILTGIWALLALTGSLQSKVKNPNTNESSNNNNFKDSFTIYGSNIRIPSLLQIFTFVLALIFTVIFGVNSITSVTSNSETLNNIDCIKIIKETRYWIENPKKIDTTNVK